MINPIPSSIPQKPAEANLAVLSEDPRGFARLLELILSRAGISQNELALRLGINGSAISNRKRIGNPTIQWLVRIVNLCGGKVWVELPSQSLKTKIHYSDK